MRKRFFENAIRQISYIRVWPKIPVPPNIIHVEPSGGCNLRCITCPQSVADKKLISESLMGMDTFDAIIKQAKGFFKEVYFAFGGEPLLNPNLPEMIEKAGRAGLLTTVHTNATLLTRKRSEELIKSGLNWITLNIIDDKNEYETVRQGARFEISLANIVNFLEAKRDFGRGPYTTLQSIKLYSPEMGVAPPRISPEFLKQFDGLPLDRTVCAYAHHFGGDFAEKARVDYGEPVKGENYYPCEEIWVSMAVAWNGEIRPCCIDIQGTYVLGNVSSNTLREAWNGEKMKELRRTLAAGGYADNPLCHNCRYLWRGRGNDSRNKWTQNVNEFLRRKIKV